MLPEIRRTLVFERKSADDLAGCELIGGIGPAGARRVAEWIQNCIYSAGLGFLSVRRLSAGRRFEPCDQENLATLSPNYCSNSRLGSVCFERCMWTCVYVTRWRQQGQQQDTKARKKKNPVCGRQLLLTTMMLVLLATWRSAAMAHVISWRRTTTKSVLWGASRGYGSKPFFWQRPTISHNRRLAATLATSETSQDEESMPYNQTTDDLLFVSEHEHDNWKNNATEPMVADETLSTDGGSEIISNSSSTSTLGEEKGALLWDPQKDFNMTYPKALSPSAINEFLHCPQSFLFQYVYGIRQPTSLALAKGSFCHTALEQIFDLDARDRTLQHLQNLFRKAWSQERQKEVYGNLFSSDSGDWDLTAEAEWGQQALQLLENYVNYEDPSKVARPNPVQRETWVQAHLTLDPRQGKTGYVWPPRPVEASAAVEAKDETFWVRGIVDRLDMVRSKEDNAIVLRLTDYKTGKAPELKYSPAMNDKIVAQNFFQLQIYALLLREKQGDMQNTLDLRYLRLLYLTSQEGPAIAWDYDLGPTQVDRDAVLADVHAKLSQVWMDIVQLVSQQDPLLWKGCDRSFCYCHNCRPKFLPGTVWEPPKKTKP